MWPILVLARLTECILKRNFGMTVSDIADAIQPGDRFRFPHPITNQILVWEVTRPVGSAHVECRGEDGSIATDIRRDDLAIWPVA